MSDPAEDNGAPASLPRTAKGKRPAFFDDPAVDQLLSVTLELASEVWVLRERLAAMEVLADRHDLFKAAELENFAFDAAKAADLAAQRQEFIARLFRTLETQVADKGQETGD